MKNAKSLTTILSALALLGLAQLTVHAEELDNSTPFGSNPPPPGTETLGNESSEPYENLARDCEFAWMGSSAAQSCNLKSVTEVENTGECEIRAKCQELCTSSRWICLFSMNPVDADYQGGSLEIRRLHNCDGVLQLDGC